MLKIIFMYIWLFYITLTESLFMQFFAIFIFYIASRYMYSSKDNWYYSDQKENDE